MKRERRGRRGRVCLGGVAALRWSNRCRFSCSSDEAPARYHGGTRGRSETGAPGLCWREKAKQIHASKKRAVAAGVPTAAARTTIRSCNTICSAPGQREGPRTAFTALELCVCVSVRVCVSNFNYNQTLS